MNMRTLKRINKDLLLVTLGLNNTHSTLRVPSQISGRGNFKGRGDGYGLEGHFEEKNMEDH